MHVMMVHDARSGAMAVARAIAGTVADRRRLEAPEVA
jgi:hypothetical protein